MKSFVTATAWAFRVVTWCLSLFIQDAIWHIGDVAKRSFNYIFAADTPDSEDGVQGYGPFTALATFALSQSVALTAVARGRGRDYIVLAIYAITTIITIIWISHMLRANKRPSGKQFFDRPTLVFGRYALGWTIVLGFVFLILGMFELLPNQTRKVPYNDGRIKQCIGRIQNGTNEAIDPRLDKLPIVEWLGQLSENDERLAIIQQSDVFADHYFEFSLDIRCEPPYKMARRMPFLINAEGPVALRPLSFLEPGANPTASATILVEGAEPNDRIVVFAYLQNADKPGVFKKVFDAYQFRLVSSVVKRK